MSSNKILNYLLLISLPVLTTVNNIFAQISPGDLTSAHQKLEGLSNCTKCHTLGDKVHSSKCFGCHGEIKTLISGQKGYHSSDEVKGKECSSCHNEHHGRNFKIIRFDPEKFDHGKTGFVLIGRHLEIKCSSCHSTKFIRNKNLIKRKNTYLGLDGGCISCHEDYHDSALGRQCSSCHSSISFKEAEKFDHDETSFRLTGAHTNLECIKCHPKEKKDGTEVQRFKTLPFAGCMPCHKDVHAGRFGNDCTKCHETRTFRKIKSESFDHNKTEFPLIGKHKITDCRVCHKSEKIARVKLKYGKCSDCHADYHEGEFRENGILKDCSNCHDEAGFKSSLFGIEEHSQSRFKLTGAHLATACQSCHYKNNKWQFRFENRNCSGCHENVHGKEINPNRMPDECSSCHFTDKWSFIKYDHKITGFELTGKHRIINCKDCHLITEDSHPKLVFVSVDPNCDFCHRDVHYSQFRRGDETDCSRCHTSDNWEAVKFNHDESQFPLKGAHKETACSGCHKRVSAPEISYINYKIKDFRCEACHS